MQAVIAERLVGEAPDPGTRDRLLRPHQVVVRLGLGFEDVAFEIEPERGVGEWKFADLLALGEDRQPSALMVEMLELDCLERALTKPIVEQQPERDSITEIFCARDDRSALIVPECAAVHGASACAFDREGRVAMEAAAHDLKAEEILEDREILVVVAGATVPVLGVEELLDSIGAGRRLERGELQIGEEAGELVESALVIAVA